MTPLAAVALLLGQPPADKPPAPPPDETKVIVKEITEAYKAPLEADNDIRDELRGQYKNPTPEREAKLLYEVRRLYQTTPEQEAAIRRELAAAYRLQTPEQEARVFAEIRRNGTLPPGTVHPTTQAEQAGKLFRKLDLDGDGRLTAAELPPDLRGQLAQWDRDRDGAVSPDEYTVYFLSRHQVVAKAVVAGEITLKLPKGVPGPTPMPAAEARPVVMRAGKLPPGLPAWFAEYDTDRDGMVGLYEWRRRGRPISEFVPMDKNQDGYLTPKEVLDYLAEQERKKKEEPPPAVSPKR